MPHAASATRSSMSFAEDLYLDVSISAVTKVFDLPPVYIHGDVAGLLVDAVAGRRTLTRPGTNEVNSSYRIHARFSMPVDGRILPVPAVQILVHGLTYDKHYWTGLHEGLDPAINDYDWAFSATNKGYYTLNIDRLGYGKSTRANPVHEMQDAVQAEILHEIITQLRCGSIKGIKFSRIIVVGHSYGSILGSIVSNAHPSDIDQLVLTGWTKTDMSVVGNEIFQAQVCASEIYPTRFGALPPGYLVIGRQAVREEACFSGSYDASMVQLDWNRQEVSGLGELTSETIVSKFSGDVLCVVGREDLSLAKFALGAGTVEDGEVQATREVFPLARVCDWHVVPDTGHCMNLHRSARSTGELVFAWLDRMDYMGAGVGRK